MEAPSAARPGLPCRAGSLSRSADPRRAQTTTTRQHQQRQKLTSLHFSEHSTPHKMQSRRSRIDHCIALLNRVQSAITHTVMNEQSTAIERRYLCLIQKIWKPAAPDKCGIISETESRSDATPTATRDGLSGVKAARVVASERAASRPARSECSREITATLWTNQAPRLLPPISVAPMPRKFYFSKYFSQPFHQ